MSNPTMLTYINQEQSVLTNIINQYPKNLEPALEAIAPTDKKWLVLATGSSINAANSAKYYIQHIAGIQVNVQQPYNYQHFEPLDKAEEAVIGISQSGQSTATIDAIKAISQVKTIRTVAVTSLPGKELSDACDQTLDILTGRERVGYVSMGFSATVLNLMLLGLRIACLSGKISSDQEKQELVKFQTIINQIDDTIDQTSKFVNDLKSDLTAAVEFSVVTFGPMMGIADELETKFTETVRIPTHSYELEAFMHGPYLSVNPDHRILFIETPGAAEITDKMSSLYKYETKYTKHLFNVSLGTDTKLASHNQLKLPTTADEYMTPLLGATVIQIFAWYTTIFHGINLSHLIFEDFSTAVHNKTAVQDYV